jgi:regulator of PEP synthase PpsR (kinase-PPPase family)
LQPYLNIISDSVGDSAAVIVEAAASQFDCEDMGIRRLPNASSLEQVAVFVQSCLEEGGPAIFFYTIADVELRSAVAQLLDQPSIYALDVLGPAIDTIATATGLKPANKPGLIRKTGAEYYHRVEAMEFAVDHDDGRNPEQLKNADIVLIGSSRTSKTPLAIYMATLGYKVANVPLVPGVEPPAQLFDVEPRRIFGLMSNAALLANIRNLRLGNAKEVAARYASIEYVQEDLDDSRQIMRRLGCLVVRTDNRAIEETAQEILRYYDASQS